MFKLAAVSVFNKKGNTDTDSSPYVAAVIRHYVGMFAALHYDNFLLDDREIILCGTRQRESEDANEFLSPQKVETQVKTCSRQQR